MTLGISSLKKSPKLNGKYEEKIISKVYDDFYNQGYEVRKHISLNIAWGSVLSEIDLIAIKDNLITIIEVKSKKDKIPHAKIQFDKIKQHTDYYIVASDEKIKDYALPYEIGIIYIDKDYKLNSIRKPSLLKHEINKSSLKKLKKSDLIKIYKKYISNNTYKNKEGLCIDLIKRVEKVKLKKEVKKILLNVDG